MTEKSQRNTACICIIRVLSGEWLNGYVSG